MSEIHCHEYENKNLHVLCTSHDRAIPSSYRAAYISVNNKFIMKQGKKDCIHLDR